jgi:hypothetical protein
MSDSHQSVILVYSTSHAIRLESLLKSARTSCRLIPVPRHLSSDCGVCVRFDDENRGVIDQVLTSSGLEIQGVVPISG